MKRRLFRISLILGTVCVAYPLIRASDSCGDDVDECMVVTGERITCPDGAQCTSEPPEQLERDCYMDLVDLEEAPNAYVSSLYGESRESGPHNGIDIAVPTGTPVKAMKSGTVYEVVSKYAEGDKTTKNGNYVRIKYKDGSAGAYIHLLKANVKKDQEVIKGEVIGESNDTGASDGPHLHYTRWSDTTRTDHVDPAVEHPDC